MGVELLNIDCMEYMATLPDKAFDLAIVDPPYGIGWDREYTIMSAGIRKDGTRRKNKSWSNSRPKAYLKNKWDNAIPNETYFEELRRVSIKQIVWGGNYFTEYLQPSGGWVTWEKGVPDGMSLSQCELAWTNCLNSIRHIRLMWAGYKKCEDTDRIHPTQKPVKLYRWLLENYAKPSQRILDTHLGSGSSAIAAHYFGCDFVGCELDKDYFEAAKKRFEQQTKQMAMF